MNKIFRFLQEAKEELMRVNWPTQKQVVNYTIMVVAVSLVVAAVLGGLDFLFSAGVNKYLVK